MQDGPGDTPDNKPTTEAQKSLPKADGNHTKRNWLLVAGLVLVAGLIVGFSWFGRSEGSQANQEKSGSKSKEAGLVLSYDDCVDSRGSTVDEEGGVCTTAEGVIFYPGDDYSGNEGNTAEDLTEVVGDQSARLVIGPDSPAFLWGSPNLLITDGSSTMTLPVQVITTNIELNDCTLSVKSTPDKPGIVPVQYSKAPLASEDIVFIDGRHVVALECKVKGGSPIKITKEFGVADRKPEQCADFSFTEPLGSTFGDVNELRTAMNGTWKGCVDTPWWASYYVTITFNPDGTYNASSTESLDGQVFDGGIYYYNAGGSNPAKVFGINAFNSGAGSGYLDVVRLESNTTQRAELRNVKLNGSTMSFDFHLGSSSSAVHFKLNKQ